MPRKKQTGLTFDIRLQITVEEGSIDHIVLEYLSDGQASTFGKAQRIMMAAKPFWQALALKSKNFPLERVRQALLEGEYLWRLQKLHVCEQVGIEPGVSQFDLADERLKGRSSLVEPEREQLTNWDIKPESVSELVTLTSNPNSSTDSDQIVQANAASGSTSGSEKASKDYAEVLEAEATQVDSKPFNPFGNGIIVRS